MFDRAITHSSAYDAQLRELHDRSMFDEALFLELAVDDLVRAADLFSETYEQT
jgi:transaldolase